MSAPGFAALDRRTWPLLLWFVYSLLVVNLPFFRSDIGRHRYPTLPVMMAFAGAAVVRVHGWLGGALAATRRRAWRRATSGPTTAS